MDLQDNLRVIDLVSLDKKKIERVVDYFFFNKAMNDACHFIEGAKAYHEEFAERQIKFREGMESRS